MLILIGVSPKKKNSSYFSLVAMTGRDYLIASVIEIGYATETKDSVGED